MKPVKYTILFLVVACLSACTTTESGTTLKATGDVLNVVGNALSKPVHTGK
jgi:hypothetical protein